jgi:hypothetical protein
LKVATSFAGEATGEQTAECGVDAADLTVRVAGNHLWDVGQPNL